MKNAARRNQWWVKMMKKLGKTEEGGMQRRILSWKSQSPCGGERGTHSQKSNSEGCKKSHTCCQLRNQWGKIIDWGSMRWTHLKCNCGSRPPSATHHTPSATCILCSCSWRWPCLPADSPSHAQEDPHPDTQKLSERDTGFHDMTCKQGITYKTPD